MNLSYWEKQIIEDENKIVIIGAGIVGLCTGIELKKMAPDVEVLILDRGNLPTGASTKNAGFACFGSVTEILSDLQTMNHQDVANIITKRFLGLEKLKAMTDPRAFDYHQFGGYEVFDKGEDLPDDHSLNEINDLLFSVIGHKNVFKIKKQYQGFALNKRVIHNKLEGQLNPAKLVFSLTQMAARQNIRILYNTEISEVNEGFVLSHQLGRIPFQKLAVCTNGFARNLIPFLEVVPARNQVLITKPIIDLRMKGTFHYNKGYVYFRNVGNRILLGGARHIDFSNEETSEFGTSRIIMEYLQNFLTNKISPEINIEIDYWWSGIMGIGPTKETIVTEIRENQYVGVRMGGMGVAIGSIIGQELAELIMA